MSRVDVRLIGVGAPIGTAVGSRPNDGSGYWADASNTGYTHEPGYTGSVTNYVSGMTQSGWVPVQETSGTTLAYRRFLGKTGVGYDGGGNSLTFVGCRFEAVQPNDNLVQIYCPGTVTFRHCTFKPANYSTPPGTNGALSSARTSPGTPYDESWQYIARMVPGVTVFDRCNIWGNAGIQCTGGTDADNPSIFRDCYIHDQADNNSTGAPPGQDYHHDGIGPDSEGGGHDTLIERCTIASLGTTNGIALQGSSTYNRVTIRDNYISGWGYAVSIGATTPWAGTNITVTGNVFSTELGVLFGPLYGNLWTPGSGNTWAGNRYQVRAGDQATGWAVADHGTYWWPTDNLGHLSDYSP